MASQGSSWPSPKPGLLPHSSFCPAAHATRALLHGWTFVSLFLRNTPCLTQTQGLHMKMLACDCDLCLTCKTSTADNIHVLSRLVCRPVRPGSHAGPGSPMTPPCWEGSSCASVCGATESSEEAGTWWVGFSHVLHLHTKLLA